MNTAKHISKLIARYDYVIIPGFGGFVTNYEPAHIHPVQHLFSPPSKSIAFNKNLTSNDGLLVNHISKADDIPVSEAKEAVINFTKQCREQLQQNDVVLMPGIGRIFLDIEKKLQFIQDTAQNHLLESYGLPEVKSPPVLRKKLLATNATVAKDGEAKGKMISGWWVSIAALFLLMIGLFTWSLLDDKINLQTSELFSPLKNEKTSGEKSRLTTPIPNAEVLSLDFSNFSFAENDITTKKTDQKSLPAVVDNREVPRTEITNSEIPKGIYVVVGSFLNEANAVELNQHLRNDGFTSYRIPSNNKFIRVGVFISTNLREAYDDLQVLRDKYGVNAWLMKNQ